MSGRKETIVVQQITSILVPIIFNFFFASYMLFNLFIIYGTSSHHRSAQVNVRKYVGILNCFIITRTSHKKFFWYAGVPLTELIKENALSLATNLSKVPV